LDIGLSLRGSLVAATINPRRSAGGGGSLSIRLPTGKVVGLSSGHETEFTVDPAQYYRAFGRSRNAAERASIISRILTGAPPASDPATMTPPELEALIRGIETGYAPSPK
jgi:hypothetical protein